MYLQARMTCQRLRLVRTLLQAAALWLAVGVCLSRISDYMHHWSDVLGGALLGGTIGALTVSARCSSLVHYMWPLPFCCLKQGLN